MLSRKDYKAIAEIIRGCKYVLDGQETYDSMQVRNEITGCLCDYFAADNPRFDRDRFMEACGL